ncbi:hypothetical protein EKO27_g402 [Xylaria grammica]|uniref:Peptidase C14 caspase domain-containing protein n=1 Tax=Xylaria grammica TaxID=363999 RepID=A0A439DJU7_9PEZI|nr:hypothetical protein EKO27_g402 [Xylaria grammica]
MNDVERMDRVLRRMGFETFRCSGPDATRAGILEAWEQFINELCADDAVVVYYSGHGGLAASAEPADRSFEAPDPPTPWRYQFLVPMDFDEFDEAGGDSDEGDGRTGFRGILDIELSALVRDTTARTPNLTLILDCCYAGRMARDPTAATVVAPRTISTTAACGEGCGGRFAAVSRYADSLCRQGRLPTDLHIEQSPYAVRIAAAAAGETAWEYRSQVIGVDGVWHGALTEALLCILEGGDGESLGDAGDSGSNAAVMSWRTVMLRVAELVNVRFPYQHPEVAGPADRLPFQVRELVDGAFHIRMEGNSTRSAVIQAGRVSGVREGNIYTVVPFGVDKAAGGASNKWLGEAMVTSATPFKATADFIPRDPAKGAKLPTEGALAFLKYDALYRWPVLLPPGLERLAATVQKSRFVRPRNLDDGDLVLAEFREWPGRITLHNNRGRDIALVYTTRESLGLEDRLVEAAEQLARGQHLLSLSSGGPAHLLQHEIEVKFGLVDEGGHRGRTIRQDGTDSIFEGDRVYIELINRGLETVHVWVFDVNATGQVKLVSKSSPRGVELPSGRVEVLGAARHLRGLKGLAVGWPAALSQSRGEPVEETLVFICTSSPVDLSHLCQANKPSAARMNLSFLEQLTSTILSGESRKATAIEDDDEVVRYATIRIPMLLFPKASLTDPK